MVIIVIIISIELAFRTDLLISGMIDRTNPRMFNYRKFTAICLKYFVNVFFVINRSEPIKRRSKDWFIFPSQQVVFFIGVDHNIYKQRILEFTNNLYLSQDFLAKYARPYQQHQRYNLYPANPIQMIPLILQNIYLILIIERVFVIEIQRQQNLIFMAQKNIDHKNIMNKLEQVKCDTTGKILRCSLGETVKRQKSNQRKKSQEKTIKINLREPSSCKHSKNRKTALDRSKQSKESTDSLLKSTHSYFVSRKRNKRSESATCKHLKGQKHKKVTNSSNLINNTFEMQSYFSTHEKKKSNFSSTIGSKFDIFQLNKSALQPEDRGETSKNSTKFQKLLLQSTNLLERYKEKSQLLERENRRYKKMYKEAIKNIKYFEAKRQ